MGRRIDAYSPTNTYASDDYVLIDGRINGTRRILASDLSNGGGGPISGITIDVIGDPFVPNTIYEVGDAVTYMDKLWTPNQTTSAGTFQPTEWTQIDVVAYMISKDAVIWGAIGQINSDISDIGTDVDTILLNISAKFDSTVSYTAPDMVIHDKVLYKCTSATAVSGDWSTVSSDFVQTTVVAEIQAVISDLSTLSGTVTGINTRLGVAESSIITLNDLTHVYDKPYSDSSTYNTGDFVVYNSKLFECLDDNVTGTWDRTKWSLTDVPSALSKINKRGSGAHTYQGTSTPSASLGVDGDIYMQYDANGITDVYGKINGGWVLFPSNGGGGGGHVIQPLSITERTISTSTFSVTEIPVS